MRTQKEIITRLEARKEQDIFGFEVNEYLDWLDFNHAKQYLKKGVTKEKWDKLKRPNTRRNILSRMRSYMSFAWEKANNCRGISANRSIAHYEAWIWLLGDDEFLKKFNDIEYEHYGKEKLVAICKEYSWDWKKWDDGVRRNTDY